MAHTPSIRLPADTRPAPHTHQSCGNASLTPTAWPHNERGDTGPAAMHLCQELTILNTPICPNMVSLSYKPPVLQNVFYIYYYQAQNIYNFVT